ncbi:cuticle protein 7-like [Vespa mandarinia]|uniref:cuticle protein 7-like n=1 Tax=Vespa mandarinia TaxID=7446 RepID=UPI0016193763|nr:cuticle protein 7-like [Vespa mandarinia]XP_035742448.1 cuticle protein 7-like [Vespa mandarinia]
MNVLLGYQDSLGRYSFGYSTLDSARSEIKTVNGVIHGAYSYVDDNGVIQSTEYIADDDGFRVVATNLPQLQTIPNEDTAEVSTVARKAHLEDFLIAEKMAKDIENEKERTNVSEPKKTVEITSSINDKSSGSIAIDQLPVPVFGISYGDQVLVPMGKN